MITTLRSLLAALGPSQATVLQALERLRNSVSLPHLNAADLCRQLQFVRQELVKHFRFEEQNGYMEAVRSGEPRLEHAINGLLDEHRRLEATLDDLIAETAAGKLRDRDLDNRILAWIEKAQAHEFHETDILQDSFNLDLGGGD